MVNLKRLHDDEDARFEYLKELVEEEIEQGGIGRRIRMRIGYADDDSDLMTILYDYDSDELSMVSEAGTMEMAYIVVLMRIISRVLGRSLIKEYGKSLE